MLTADLIIYHRRKRRVYPKRIDPSQPAARGAAAELLQVAHAFIGQTRGELEAALSAQAPTGLTTKIARGLIKVLLDGCRFSEPDPQLPRTLRETLFDASARAWRIQGAEDLARWRTEALQSAGYPHGLSAEATAQAMFADLPEYECLEAMPAWEPDGLLARYNVAQVQGLLIHADALTVSLGNATPQRLRQLLRYLKFFGLLFRVGPQVQKGSNSEQLPHTPKTQDSPKTQPSPQTLCIHVDGPLSVLRSTTRYGLDLAGFFPALLLCAAPWQILAQVKPRRVREPLQLELEPDPAYRSHYPDTGQWLPEPVRQFGEVFNNLRSPWGAAPAEQILTLADNRYLVPDFELTHPLRARPLYLEHVTYPSDATLTDRLARVESLREADYALAARMLPSYSARVTGSPHMLLYRRRLLPRTTRDWLDKRYLAG